MGQRIGTYITKRLFGEPYKVYIPPRLPPTPAINLEQLYGLLEKATLSVAELNNLAKSLPNISLFIYISVRKEAVLSSQIDGLQSSFLDLVLFEHHQEPEASLKDTKEIFNYVESTNYGLKCLKENFPISLRLLKEMHAVLLSDVCEPNKLPGEFRNSQNWIEGTRPGNALFIPPPVEVLQNCLSNLEIFLHHDKLPALIKAGIAHVQFETIHPFLGGNGRLGRSLILLMLIKSGMLNDPALYLSLYFKKNRDTYYDLLQEVRLRGAWESWLEFFLEGIFTSSKQAINMIKKVNELFAYDFKKISTLGRPRFSCEKVLEYLKFLPQASVPLLAKELEMSAPTVRSALNHMVGLEILEEVSGKRRDKIYVYKNYLNILEEGTEPFLTR